ncbi:hypothetical protein FRC01_001263 [Tulasnella sp. 417]|nr:hypothetical protein FRC01_001263 [Tulasnella sp. 417]
MDSLISVSSSGSGSTIPPRPALASYPSPMNTPRLNSEATSAPNLASAVHNIDASNAPPIESQTLFNLSANVVLWDAKITMNQLGPAPAAPINRNATPNTDTAESSTSGAQFQVNEASDSRKHGLKRCLPGTSQFCLGDDGTAPKALGSLHHGLAGSIDLNSPNPYYNTVLKWARPRVRRRGEIGPPAPNYTPSDTTLEFDSAKSGAKNASEGAAASHWEQIGHAEDYRVNSGVPPSTLLRSYNYKKGKATGKGYRWQWAKREGKQPEGGRRTLTQWPGLILPTAAPIVDIDTAHEENRRGRCRRRWVPTTRRHQSDPYVDRFAGRPGDPQLHGRRRTSAIHPADLASTAD